MTEWQPIETAPKDGMKILVYCPDMESTHIFIAYHHERDAPDLWSTDAMVGVIFDSEITHWMPIPQPPGDDQS